MVRLAGGCFQLVMTPFSQEAALQGLYPFFKQVTNLKKIEKSAHIISL